MKLDLTSPYSPSWKDVGQLTEKAGTKLEISTIDCNLLHSYVDEDTSTFTSPGIDSSSFTMITTPPSTQSPLYLSSSSSTSSPLHPSPTPTPCPSGWSGFEGNCYKYYDISVSWEDATKQCLKEKVFSTHDLVLFKSIVQADLASIHSKAENEFVREITGSTLWLWLGGRRSCPDCEDFKWSDGTPMDFTAWYKGEPNNHVRFEILTLNTHHYSKGGTEECIEQYGSGKHKMKWNDFKCDHPKRFVCKKSSNGE